MCMAAQTSHHTAPHCDVTAAAARAGAGVCLFVYAENKQTTDAPACVRASVTSQIMMTSQRECVGACDVKLKTARGTKRLSHGS